MEVTASKYWINHNSHSADNVQYHGLACKYVNKHQGSMHSQTQLTRLPDPWPVQNSIGMDYYFNMQYTPRLNAHKNFKKIENFIKASSHLVFYLQIRTPF